MAAKIGIKLADGSFFPIMDDDSSVAETLELTTVHDHQQSVQINLFKKEDEDSEPSYIGSLIVEDIHEKGAGEPTIELHLALDEEKNLSAEAVDADSGVRQSLKVSLETLDEHTFDDIDFDLNSETADADIELSSKTDSISDIDEEYQDFSTTPFYMDDDEKDAPRSKRGIPVWLLGLLVLLGIAALALGVLLLTKKSLNEDSVMVIAENRDLVPAEDPAAEKNEPSVSQPSLPADEPVTEPPTAQSKQDASSTQVLTESKVMHETAESKKAVHESAAQDRTAHDTATDSDASHETVSRTVTAKDTGTYGSQANSSTRHASSGAAAEKAKDNEVKGSATSGQNAVRYQLRWGDTLWDLSETYYRNPWLYLKIAEHNKLKNPDVIVSGTYIEIPPQ